MPKEGSGRPSPSPVRTKLDLSNISRVDVKQPIFPMTTFPYHQTRSKPRFTLVTLALFIQFSTPLLGQQVPGNPPNQTVGNEPSNDPSTQADSNNFKKPALSQFPTDLPAEQTPSDPSGKVPFGTNENYSFVEKSFLGDGTGDPNTHKLDLLNAGIKAENIAEYSSTLLNLVNKLGGDRKKSEEVRLKLKTKAGISEKIFKIASENAKIDQVRMLKREANELERITLLADKGADPEKGFQLTERFEGKAGVGSKALGLALNSGLALDNLLSITTDSTSSGDIVEGLELVPSSVLSTKKASFFKIAQNPKALNRLKVPAGSTVNPTVQLFKLNPNVLEAVGGATNLSDVSLSAVIDICTDSFAVIVGNTPVVAPIQFSEFDAIDSNLVAEIGGKGSAQDLKKEMEQMMPTLFVSAGSADNAITAKVKARLAQMKNESATGRRSYEALGTADFKAAVRDTFVSEVNGLIAAGRVDATAMKSVLQPNHGTEAVSNVYYKSMEASDIAGFASNLNRIVPDEFEAVSLSSRAAGSNQFANVQNRLSSIRLAKMGYPVSDGLLGSMVAKAMADSEKEDSHFAQAGGSLVDNYARRVLGDDMPEFTRGYFAQISGSFTDDELLKLNGESLGLTIGYDQEVMDGFTLGMMVGLGKADSDGVDTKLETDSFFAGVYGNYVKGDEYFEGYATYGYHDAFSERDYNSTSTMKSSPDSRSLSLGLTYGKVYEHDSLLLTPSIGLSYENVRVGSYSETGGLAPHSVKKQNYDSLIATLGGKVQHYEFLETGGALIPELRAYWQHDFKSDAVDMNVQLVGSGTDYVIKGRTKDSDFGSLGAGLTFLDKDGSTVYGHYDYVIGKSDFQAHNVSLGFRFRF